MKGASYVSNIDISSLEQQLNSFDSAIRCSALEELASGIESGDIRVPNPKEEVNLHFHTFFSFNAEGWSPSRIAWESMKYGLEVAGIVDFDVLDGMNEFLAAGDLLGLKSVVGLESRVFVKELADKVINSPKEPGISYFMASGCTKRPPAGSESERILNSMLERAGSRNIALVDLVNKYLDVVQLDYKADAVPLTPAGNVTERHLLLAYDIKARKVFGNDTEKLATFWSAKLGISKTEADALIDDTPKFHEKMRAKLMKFGGMGYIAPDAETFPSIEEVVSMIRGMDALPMGAWLDGTNPGEENAEAFVELLLSKGVVALNIVPDRNWNYKPSDEKTTKIKKLQEIVEACRKFNMPICVGTEMNKLGLPFVDDFSAPELQPYVQDFVDGARCLYAHTVLSRFADFGYLSPAAHTAFGQDVAAKNKYFTTIGRQLWAQTDKEKIQSLIAAIG